MSKPVSNVPNQPMPHRAGRVPVLRVIAAGIATTLLTGGCGSGGGKSVSPLGSTNPSGASGTPVAATSRVVVSLQWPDLATPAGSRRISKAVRRVVFYVTNTTSTDPSFVLFQQTLSRPEGSGTTQTVVFPSVPLRDNLYLTAVALDENGLIIATARQPIDKAAGGTQTVHLSLVSTAASLSVTNEPDYEEFTQTLGLDAKTVGIPVGASRVFTVRATDASGQGVFLDPDDVQVSLPPDGFSQTASSDGRLHITANKIASASPDLALQFTVIGSSAAAFVVPVAGTANVGVSALNIKAGVNTPPLAKIGKAFVRPQAQALTFGFSVNPHVTGIYSDDVKVEVRYVGVFDPKTGDAFADYAGKDVKPDTVLSFTGANGIYQGTFTVNAAQVTLTDGTKAGAGNASNPVLYQIILTSKDGTGRAIVPVLINEKSGFGITGPNKFYKNTPGAVFNAPAPDEVTFSAFRLDTDPVSGNITETDVTSAKLFTLTPNGPVGSQSVSLIPVDPVTKLKVVPPTGDYLVRATRTATGDTQNAPFTVPPVVVTVADAAGTQIALTPDDAKQTPVVAKYLLKGIRQTFKARVSNLDLGVGSTGVTWTLDSPASGILSNVQNDSVDYQLPFSPTGYASPKIYTLTAQSNDDPASSMVFQVKIVPGFVGATIQ